MIRKADAMRTEVRDKMKGGTGAVTIVHCLEKQDLEADVRLCARLVVHPGSSIGAHQHDTEDEIFIVHAGTGVVDDNGTEIRVSAGDTILTGKGESHAVRNDGAEDLVMTAVIACYPNPQEG